MKRSALIIPFILLPAALLSACGSTDTAPPQTVEWNDIANAANSEDAPSNPTDAAQPQAPDSSEPAPPADEADARTPTDDDSGDVYREIYTQAVSENTDPVSFSLIYLDNDDIPELVVFDGYYSAYSIYTVKEGALSCMVDFFSTVELTYFERSGIIAGFARWNGGGDEGGYGRYYYTVSADAMITDDTAPALSYDYNAVYDEAGNYTGEGVIRYYSLGAETDEALFQEKLSEWGVTEGGDVVPDFLEKEEVLSRLRER